MSWRNFWSHRVFLTSQQFCLTSWRTLWCHGAIFEVMTYFWHHNQFFDVLTNFGRHDKLFDVLTNFGRHEKLVDVLLASWPTYWRHDVFLALCMTNFLTLKMTYFWRHANLFSTSWRTFWRHDVFLTLWRTFWWGIFDVMINFLR